MSTTRAFPDRRRTSRRIVATTVLVLQALIKSQRWVPPTLLFLACATSVIAVSGGSTADSFAAGCVVLFPISAWLAVVVFNLDDEAGRAVLITAAGGFRRQHAARVAAALVLVSGLVVPCTVYVMALNGDQSIGHFVTGLLAEVVVAASGIVVGSVFSRPLTLRPAVGVFGIIVVTLAELFVPHALPLRKVMGALSDHEGSAIGIARVLLVSVAVTVVLLCVSLELAWRRNQ